MSKPFGYIYLITNTLTGKRYIGQAKNPRARWRQHQNKRAWCRENATFEVIDEAASKSELLRKEIHYVELYGTMTPRGYNKAKPGFNPTGGHHDTAQLWARAHAAPHR